MGEFVTFVGNHYILCGSFIALLVLLIWDYIDDFRIGAKLIEPGEATALINREHAVVVDIRTQAEYNKGHVVDSIHVPLEKMSNYFKILEQHRDKPIIVFDQTGNLTGKAAETLKKEGFKTLYRLKGGVVSWTGANLPLVRA
jgi:rhodanese-related sulfurtransferase